MESEIRQLTLSSSRRLGDRHRGRGQGQEEEIELRIKHQVHGGDIMPRLPWLPPAFPPERSLRQGLAKERKINKKKKRHILYTANNKKGTKTPHAKAKITIKTLPSIST